MSNYICAEPVGKECYKWVEFKGSSIIPNLTPDQAWQLFIATAMLFAVAWVFKELGFFIKRR